MHRSSAHRRSSSRACDARRALAVLLVGTGVAACNPDRLPPVPIEVDRPFLSQNDPVTPEEAAIRVDPGTSVTIRFNEAMDPQSFENHMMVATPDGSARDGAIEALNASVVFRPSTPLDEARLHRIELRGRVRDANGNTIERNGQPVLDETTLIFESWFFTSGPYDAGGSPISYVLDTRGRLWIVSEFVAQTGRLAEGLGAAPRGLVRSGDALVILNPAASEAVVLDSETAERLGAIPVPDDPVALGVAGSDVYVVSARGKAVTRLDLSAISAPSRIDLGFFPGMITASPDGSRLYTLDQVTGNLVVIDAQTGDTRVGADRLIRIPVTGEIAVDPASGQVYVADTRAAKLHVLAADGTGPVKSFDESTVGNLVWRPLKLVFSGGDLFVVLQNQPHVARMDPGSGAVHQVYSFEAPVKGIEVLPGGNPMLVLSGVQLLLVDIETGTIMRSVDLPDSNAETVLTVN